MRSPREQIRMRGCKLHDLSMGLLSSFRARYASFWEKEGERVMGWGVTDLFLFEASVLR